MNAGAGYSAARLFAAVSMGLRIEQHRLSPERIWALIAIAVAVATGLPDW
ncbi:MAG: hypothetical protein R3D83_07520 [Caenibius sp.]